ncbi:MAG TPA: CotH kinase family protein [Saprospiraceae bacterium]|nr:CotH kinase family protein [Saprospiraceae bacterium]
MHKTTLTLVSLFFLSRAVYGQSGLATFDDSYVHEIRVYFQEPNFWQILSDNYFLENDNDPATENLSLKAEVIIDGQEISEVGVRQKGFFSNWGAGDALKKPLKLDFNEFNPDGEHDNLKSLNLQNAFKDPSFMRDVLSYRILRDFGVAAPRTAYAKVFLNDTYWGLYVMVESVNKTFLKEHFGDNDGNLYKANWTSLQYLGANQEAYVEDFELKTNETENDWSRLIKFLKVVNQTPNIAFRDSLVKYMDMESYFKSMAVDVTIQNWDSHFDHGRNFYLYDNPTDGKFYWIPWDYNLAFASGFEFYDIALVNLRSQPGYDKVLPRRVLSNATLRGEYLEVACQLHQATFTEEHLFPVIDETELLIAQEVENDPNKFFHQPDVFHNSLNDGMTILQVDSFHLVDSVWNGSMWVVTDTTFIFQYVEEFVGLKSMISERHVDIQTELTNKYQISCTVATSDPEASLFLLDVWPNPATDWLQIKAEQPGLQFTIFDAQGRLLRRGEPQATQFSIPVANLPEGVYWLECRSDQGRHMKKFVINRD